MEHHHEPESDAENDTGMIRDFWEAVNRVCDRHGIARPQQNPPAEASAALER